MRHRTALLAAGTALLLLTGTTAATAAGTDAGPAGGTAGKKPPQCAPAKPNGKLENALRDVKIALGANGGKVTDKVVAIFARDMGISTAKARQVLEQVFRDGRSGPKKPGDPGKGGKDDKSGPATVFTAADLAKALGVSKAKAQTALDALQKLAKGPRGTVDENSPAFAAVAAKLGVTPQQLTKAIIQLKTAAGKPGEGKPVPCKPAPGKPGEGKPAPGKPAAGKH